MKKESDTNTEAQIDSNQLHLFSRALKASLDQIKFPASPERITRLMELFSLSKPQVYRITSGKTAPTLDVLAKLRGLNISIDDLLDHLKNSADQEPWQDGRIDISGTSQHCLLKLVPLSPNAPVFAVTNEDQLWQVMPVTADTPIPVDARGVDKIQMVHVRPTLAIVEDNKNTLTTFCTQLNSCFRVTAFSEGSALLRSSRVNKFDCYLLDWCLGDISGKKLVTSIRQISSAPIFIVTGIKSSRDIAELISSANVRYVVKPIDEVILAAEMLNAIALHSD
jgi:CheY-like chemotaxis protein